MPRQGAFPGVSFQDCSYKTPRWGSKDRGLFTRSPVRRPEAPNPGVGRAVLPLVARREGPSFSSSRWVPRHPWAVAASFPSLLPWSHVLLPWVSPLPTETPVTGAGPTPAHYDLIFINCLCKDPISK